MAASLTPEQIRTWTVASCEAQGVPLAVSDPRTLRRVMVLLTGRPPQRAEHGAAAGRSQLPDGGDASRVELAAGDGGPVDDGMVEQRADDGLLSGQVQVGPVGS